MILNLIIALGISILFTETPVIHCDYANAFGCYYPNKKIVYLVYQSEDLNYALYHELGHIIFDKDKNIKKIIFHYKPLKNYEFYSINGFDVINEKVADYFAEYNLYNKEFSVKYPVLYIYFRNRVNKILK